MMPLCMTCGKIAPSSGHFTPGHARFIRISTMNAPPASAINMESTRYRMPVTRWSRLNTLRKSATELLLHPLGELLGCLYDQHTLHFVVAESAELCAGQLEAAGARGREPQFDRHPGNGVLLHPQVGEKE